MKKQKIIWNDKRIQKILRGREFKRLDKAQLERLKSLFQTPGREEFALYKKMLGHTPAKAMHIMAQEFVERFPNFLTYEYVRSLLSPCRSWIDLDIKITRFARELRKIHLYKELAQNPDSGRTEPISDDWWRQLDFWDKVRYLVSALPQPRDHLRPNSKPQTKKIDITKSCYYAECKFCWRTVPFHPGDARYSKKLCFEHDLVSNHPTIRKHRRLKKQVNDLALQIREQLKPLYPTSVNQWLEYREINKLHMLNARISPLKNLVAYLIEINDGYKDEEDLLNAFHGPFPENLDKAYREAMRKYIYNNANFEPLVLYQQLARAEAWLTLLQSDKRYKNGKTYRTTSFIIGKS